VEPGDERNGHGTHVTGSIAGNANLAPSWDGTEEGRTEEHNGAAPHVKLIVEAPLAGLPGSDLLRQ